MREESPRKPPRFYPKLWEAFDGKPEMSRLEGLPVDLQHEASKRLALEGIEAAAAYVRSAVR